MSKDDLQKLTVKELEAKCKELGLTYYSGKKHLTKSEMIDKLSGVENVSEDTEKPWVLNDKDKYIEEAQPGTLIAFVDDKGKPRTAALVNRSASRRVIKVETEFNWTFVVPYDNVLWVRNGSRWPKGVYKMLKEYKNGRATNITEK